MTRIEKVLAKKIVKAGIDNSKGSIFDAYGRLRRIVEVKTEKDGYGRRIVAVEYRTLRG